MWRFQKKTLDRKNGKIVAGQQPYKACEEEMGTPIGSDQPFCCDPEHNRDELPAGEQDPCATVHRKQHSTWRDWNLP